MEKNFLQNSIKKQKGFTLIEVLVSVFIVIALTTLVLVNFELGGYNFALDRSTKGLAQQIRAVEEMALASKQTVVINGFPAVPRGGYGIYFHNIDYPDKYILFSDIGTDDVPADHRYGPEDQTIAEYSLEKEIIFSNIYLFGAPVNNLSIVFVPPDPKVFLNGSPVPSAGNDFFAKIILSSISGATNSVLINGVGLVELGK